MVLLPEGAVLVVIQAATTGLMCVAGEPPLQARALAFAFVCILLALNHAQGSSRDNPLIVASTPSVLACCWLVVAARQKKSPP